MQKRHALGVTVLVVSSWIVLSGCQATGPLLDRPVGPKKGVNICAPQPQYKGDLPTTHTVKAKETLWSMAQYYYGDGKAWGRIAKANGIPDSNVKAGATLTIPK